ncbi:MAG: hypothetical protein ACR2QM_13705 [Longimicrobiales bacterium]
MGAKPHAVALLDQAFGDALTPNELRLVVGLLGRLESAVRELVDRQEAARRG